MGHISPSDREMELLKVLWKLGESSVRQVLDELAPNGELAFNTVQTQLRIMEGKGLVEHRADGRTFLYKPLYSQQQASNRFLDKVFDGAMRDLVVTLLGSKRFKDTELDELEALVKQARKQKNQRKKQ